MAERTFDIFVNNIPLQIFFDETEKLKPAWIPRLVSELKPVLTAFFDSHDLREAVELITPDKPYAVKVLTSVEFSKKKKSYNPKGYVYGILDGFKNPPRWWTVGSDMTDKLPTFNRVWDRSVQVRFGKVGQGLDNIPNEKFRELARNIIGVPAPPPRPAAPPPRPAAPAPPPAPAPPTCETILAREGITSRKDFLRWAITNHPDKGGDTTKFQEVSNCVDKQFGKARLTRKKRKNRKMRKTSRR